MKRSWRIEIAIVLWLGLTPAPLWAAGLRQASGKVTLLRVHDLGTGYGAEPVPPDVEGNKIDVEVVFWLDSRPGRAFGFQLRDDENRAARQGMLDLLRDAFNHGWTVTTDYQVDDPQNDRNHVAIRVWITDNLTEAYQYAAKYVCGEPNGKILPLGRYFTAINVRNPNEHAVAFTKRFTVAFPGEKPGPVSEVFAARLGPQQAFEIDCDDILEHAPVEPRVVAPAGSSAAPGPPSFRANFLKGFVVIESRHELEVVVVYAAARTDDGQVVTEHIERVPGRRLVQLKLPDLVPVPDDRVFFCRHEDDDQLLVEIKNQGPGHAAKSTTEVDFLDGTKRTAVTAALGPGESIKLLFDPPPGFFDPGQHNFRITADVLDKVTEEDETNNVADGQCDISEPEP